MDNVRNFPDCSSIDEEAAAWLARLDADEKLSADEKNALREWLARSPRHQQALKSLAQFWSNNALTELMVPLGRQDQSGWLSALGAFFASRSFAAAAFASIAIVCSLFFFSSNTSQSTNGLYVTAVGQQETILLEDGSTVYLNTNSQLQVNYEKGYRNLRLLQGEAYFEVAHAPDRPFRVYAGAGRVQALGTAFNVLLENSGMNLLVTEGTVALASLGAPLSSDDLSADQDIDPFVQSMSKELATVSAGERIDLNITDGLYYSHEELSGAVVAADEDALSRVQSWKEGYLYFSGEPLEEVVSEISRYTTVSIQISDPVLKDLQIGGRFKVGDTDSMFAALEANFGIEVNQLNYNKVELISAL